MLTANPFLSLSTRNRRRSGARPFDARRVRSAHRPTLGTAPTTVPAPAPLAA